MFISCLKTTKIKQKLIFSVIMITQMFYELGPYARVIRNQLSGVVLFRNFGDININKRVAQQLGVMDQFTQAEKFTKDEKYNPVVILSPEIINSPEMRVQVSYLSDNYSYCFK